MAKYNVRYQIVGGSAGNLIVEAESSSEARKNATGRLEQQNRGKKIKIIEVIKK